MITVSGWCARGKEGVGGSVQTMGVMRKGFCPNFLQLFFENIVGSRCNDRRRELIPVFHNLHRQSRPSPSTVPPTVEYLVGVPS